MASGRPKVCVIGAGIIGSWAAVHLAEAGVETVLLEQFPLPHTRGSSHGASRGFRFLGDETMDRLDYSLECWRALEARAGQTLFLRTGMLNLGPPGDPWLAKHMAAVRAAGKDCDWLDAEAIRSRFPQLSYPPEWGAAWDPGGGLLFAHRCLAATQERFRSLGGRLLNACATAIGSGSGRAAIQVRHAGGSGEETIKCDRAVVCAGPWTARLLPELAGALETLAIPVTYWRDRTGQCEASRGFPMIYNARLTGIYCLPACEYPGLLKVLYHGGPPADPDERDRPDRGPWVAKVAAYVAEHLPTLDHRSPAIQETCMYTVTPDSEPVIDRLPHGVVAGCGFSGSGFKHSPASGRMLAMLALGRESELPAGYQLGKFSASRSSLQA